MNSKSIEQLLFILFMTALACSYKEGVCLVVCIIESFIWRLLLNMDFREGWKYFLIVFMLGIG